MKYLHALLAATAVAGAACASDTAPPAPPVSYDAQGSWGVQYTLPGFEFLMALQESSGSIQGMGTWAGEAGPSGGMAVSGTVVDDSLDLRVIFSFDPVFASPPDTAKFEGRLTTSDKIDGVLTRDDNAESLELLRLTVSDPP